MSKSQDTDNGCTIRELTNMLRATVSIYDREMRGQFREMAQPVPGIIPKNRPVSMELNRRSVGLLNYGMTCYMNASIQALCRLTGLFETLNENGSMGSALYNTRLALRKKQDAFHPEYIKHAVDLITQRFEDTSQEHDASEWFGVVLGQLVDESNTGNPLDHTPVPQIEGAQQYLGAREIITTYETFLEIYKRRINSPVDDLFRISVTDEKECSHCAYVNQLRINFERTVQIPTGCIKGTLMSTYLTKTFATQMVDQRCKYEQRVRMFMFKTKLVTIPRYLVITFNIFDNNQNKIKKNGVTANMTVQIPTLTTPTYRPKYNLVATICHVGDTIHTGHYYACVKDEIGEDWYIYNDGGVTLTTAERVSKNADTYVVFYERSQ